MTPNPGTTANHGGQDITFFVSRGCVTVSHTCSLYIELQPQSKFKSMVKANKIMPSQWWKVEFLNPQSKSKEIVIKSQVKGSIKALSKRSKTLTVVTVQSIATVSMRVMLRLSSKIILLFKSTHFAVAKIPQLHLSVWKVGGHLGHQVITLWI